MHIGGKLNLYLMNSTNVCRNCPQTQIITTGRKCRSIFTLHCNTSANIIPLASFLYPSESIRKPDVFKVSVTQKRASWDQNVFKL